MAQRRDGNTRALVAARENRDFCLSMLRSGSNLSSRFKSGLRLQAWFAPHQSFGRTKWSAPAPARGVPWRWGDTEPVKTPPLTGSYLTFRKESRNENRGCI